MSENLVKVRKSGEGKLKQLIEAGANTFYSDAPAADGGDGAGPSPHDILDAALGACTALTVTMVARRKQWPLQDVRVEIAHDENNETYAMHRKIELIGDLTAEQRQYLLQIADKCPIHKALHKRFEIDTVLAA
jgi:putative redox protein